MAKRLKCWKKLRKDTWARRGHYPEDPGSGVITVGKIPHPKGDYYVFVESKKMWKPTKFKTKSQALDHAKSFMKKHNVC